MNPPVEYVKWWDASSHCDGPWRGLDEAEEFCHEEFGFCHTVGYLVGETGDSVSYTHSLGGEQCGPVVRIPKVCVVRRTRLDASLFQETEREQ